MDNSCIHQAFLPSTPCIPSGPRAWSCYCLVTLEKFKLVSIREKSPNQTKYQYPNDCKGLPLTEMGYLDANNLETPQNFKQVKKTSNASINLQKSKAYKHNCKACLYLVCRKVSHTFSFSSYYLQTSS